MLPRHSRHFDRGLLGSFSLDIDDHILEEIQIMDCGEGFFRRFRIHKVGFCVRGGDDGKIAAEGGFDFLVEVVAMGDKGD